MGNDKEIFFEHRSLKDLECSDKLFLLLIAKEPLKDDQSTIFSSFRGMTYLTECNSSNRTENGRIQDQLFGTVDGILDHSRREGAQAPREPQHRHRALQVSQPRVCGIYDS